MPDAAERVYRRLLIVLPAALRDDAQAELLDTFRGAYARARRQRGAWPLRFWCRIAADLAVTSATERLGVRAGVTVSPRLSPAPISLSRSLMRLLTDVGMAVRTLTTQRGFTLPAVLTLVLGIGAATAIFSVVNAVLLEPLPYRDPARLVLVWQELRARSVPEFPFPVGDIPDLRAKGTLLEDVATIQTGRQTVTTEHGGPEQVRTAFVTPNTMRLLGLAIQHGRDFDDADGTPVPPPPQPAPGAPAAAAPPPPPPFATLLSHEYWQRRYGGDAQVIGQTMDFAGPRAVIVGVLVPGAELLFPPRSNVERTPDVWFASRLNFATGSRTAGAVRVIGRLRPGVTLAQAQAQMDGLAEELRSTYPVKKNAGVHINVVSMHDTLVSDVRPAIIALMGAVTFVLLIACANVANLLIAQASRRERDLAVRTALGAGRSALVRQLLAEAVLLALAGAVGGIGLARLGIAVLQQVGPANLPRLQSVSIDFQLLLFAALAALGSALLFGLLPAWRASRPNVVEVLRRSGRVAGLGAGRLRSGLVVVEVALSFVLLAGSGLMLRSMIALQRVDPGYDPNGLLTFFLPNIRAPGIEGRRAFVRQLRQELEALPGVTGVAGANPLPLDGGTANMPWGTEAAAADPTAFQQASTHIVQPGYFETMRGQLIAGRSFSDSDDHPESTAIVIDHVLAAKAFPGESAVGKRLLLRVTGTAPIPFDVIGVVRHQRHASLASEGREAIFFPDGTRGFGVANRWVVRTEGDPALLAEPIRAVVARVDPRVAIADVQPMQAFVDRAQAPTRFALLLTTVFAVIAVVLAVVGLYGVLATSVRQRTAEIGVRMAFGAERAAIFRLVVGRGLMLAAIGLVLGAAAAVGVLRQISSLLVGVSAADPATFAGISILFIVVSAVACSVPAYRASRLDATTALRAE